MRGIPRGLSLAALALAIGASFAARADDASSLEERMSYKDFTAFGLDKLSPDQLRGLNEWLKQHGMSCAPEAAASAPGAAAPLPRRPNADANRVTSRLVGEFRGWEKGTVLTLENGQKWEVRDDEPFIADRSTTPEVTVEPGMLSGWTLSVAGYNAIAHVIPVDH